VIENSKEGEKTRQIIKNIRPSQHQFALGTIQLETPSRVDQ